MKSDTVFVILEVIGICSFSLSGSIIGIRKHLDAFGVLMCALFTSFGGGLIRDVILDNHPPLMFRDYTDLIFCVVSNVLVFALAYHNKKHFEENTPAIDRINNIVDAMGLGLFTVIGMNTAIECGYASNSLFVIFLGVLTGIGGGMMRDISIQEIPFVLTKRIYALASLAGAILYYLMYVTFTLDRLLCIIVAVVFITLIRILASIFEWDMPKAF